MADSKIRQIAEAIKSTVAVSYAADTSGIDLSNRVVMGAIIEPP